MSSVRRNELHALCDRIVRVAEGKDDPLTLQQLKDRVVDEAALPMVHLERAFDEMDAGWKPIRELIESTVPGGVGYSYGAIALRMIEDLRAEKERWRALSESWRETAMRRGERIYVNPAHSKEPNGTQPTEPDPQVLRVRAPTPAPAGGQQADRRPGQADGGEPAAERGDERRPAEAVGGEGLLRPSEAALSDAALVAAAENAAAKDVAYSERDRCVQALSVAFPSYLTRHPDSDHLWDAEWLWIVVVDLPTGQASWHIHDSEHSWFAHLQVRGNQWDGHTTEEKHARIAKLAEGSGGIPLFNPAAREVHKRLQEREFAVHKRLDELGVPTDPDPKTAMESLAGCRAVDRLQWLAKDRDRWRERATRAGQEVLMSAPPVVSAFKDAMGKQCVVLRNGEVWCWEMGQGGVEGWHHRTPALPKRLQSPMEA